MSITDFFKSKPKATETVDDDDSKEEPKTLKPVTDYFKSRLKATKAVVDDDDSKEEPETLKPIAESKSKKRKLDDLKEEDAGTAPSATTSSSEPTKKRAKYAQSWEREDSKEEEALSEEQENQSASEPVTFANCEQLLEASWAQRLRAEFRKAYFLALLQKLEAERRRGVEIFPPLHLVFRAFEICGWDGLRAVLVGQDPYHDDGQAEGLCFSVQKGVKMPSSLRNMMKEATQDVGFAQPGHGSLVQWGRQGVLLLNTVLTVRAHKANSHKKYGWTTFTDRVIQVISARHPGVVFILWGKQAQKKKAMIDTTKHKIIESAHPSGLSAHRGFFGSKPYSKCNALLKELGKEPIKWQIDP